METTIDTPGLINMVDYNYWHDNSSQLDTRIDGRTLIVRAVSQIIQLQKYSHSSNQVTVLLLIFILRHLSYVYPVYDGKQVKSPWREYVVFTMLGHIPTTHTHPYTVWYSITLLMLSATVSVAYNCLLIMFISQDECERDR